MKNCPEQNSICQNLASWRNHNKLFLDSFVIVKVTKSYQRLLKTSFNKLRLTKIYGEKETNLTYYKG